MAPRTFARAKIEVNPLTAQVTIATQPLPQVVDGVPTDPRPVNSVVVTREFVKLFLDDLWKPFADAGYPQERWTEMTESIERLRPLSSRALLASYQMTMSQEVEAANGRELERLTKERR